MQKLQEDAMDEEKPAIYDDTILTIEEVAECIRVSTRTVYDWAQKGLLPGGKVGTVWRFKRGEIVKWLNERLTPQENNDEVVKIKNILTPDRVVFIEADNKIAALTELAGVLSHAPQVKQSRELAGQILKREELMSTAVGRGIAIPHVRLNSITDLVSAVGVCRHDIEDFHPVDDIPVRILIMIVAAYNQHSYYLKTLSYFSAKLKDKTLRDSILSAGDTKSVYDLLVAGEE